MSGTIHKSKSSEETGNLDLFLSSLDENYFAGECVKGWQCKPREECPAFQEEKSNLDALTSFTPEWLELASKLADLQCNGEKSWVCCETVQTKGGLNDLTGTFAN